VAKSSGKKGHPQKTSKLAMGSNGGSKSKPVVEKTPAKLSAKKAPEVEAKPKVELKSKIEAKPKIEAKQKIDAKPKIELKPKIKAKAPVRYQPPEEPVVEIPQAAAVPTNGRPRKNLAGIAPKDLEIFRDAILAKRREIVGDMSSMEREALRSSSGSNLSNLPLHMADMGTDNYEQEFTLGLMEKERKLLRDLNDALAKIQNGTYGICEGTGKPISKPRLEAQPWARYSIEYARKLEGRLR
jgi:DnaK suppressor protein